MPHLFGLQVFDIQLFQLLAMVLIVAFFAPVRSAVINGTGGRVTKIFAGWVTWLRDEVVVPNLGEKDGRRLLPMFLTLFFFIAFMNLLGLVPGGLTATASVYTAAGLSLVTLVVMVVFPVLIPVVLVLGAYIVFSGSNNADKHEKTKDDAA